MFRNLSIKQRMVAGFGIVLALMALVVVLVGIRFAEVHKLAELVALELNGQVRTANDLIVAADDETNSLRAYALTKDRKFYTDYKRAQTQRLSSLTKLRTRLSAPDEREMLAEIEGRVAELESEEKVILAMPGRSETDAAFQRHESRLRPLAHAISATAARLAASGHNRLQSSAADFESSRLRLVRFAWTSFGAALLLAIVFVVATVRTVTHSTRKIASAAAAVAQGDHERAISLTKNREFGGDGRGQRQDELGQIAAALSAMAATLQRRENSLAAHADVSAVCASSIEMDTLLEQALAELVHHTGSDLAAAYVADDEGLRVRATYGVSAEDAEAALADSGANIRQAAKARKMMVLTDIPADSSLLIEPGIGRFIPKSAACVPMVVENETIGVLVLASLHNYDPESLAIMESISAQIGVAVANARRHLNIKSMAEQLSVANEQLSNQNEELQCRNEEMQAQNEEIRNQSEEIEVQNEELLSQRAELAARNTELECLTNDLEALQSVTAVALSSLDQDELLEGLLEAACGAIGLQFGLVMLLNEDRQALTASVGYNIGEVRPAEFPVDDGLAGTAAQSRDMVCTHSTQAELLNLARSAARPPAETLIALPLVTGDRLYGVAMLGAAESRELSDREERLLQVFAERAAVAVERAQAYERLEQAEQRARADRERLRTIIDDLPEGVVIAGADGKIEMANRAALRLYGLEDAPTASLSEHAEAFNLYRADGGVISSEDLPLSRSILRGERCRGEEILIKQPDGLEIVCLCNTAPIIGDAEGEIQGAVGVFQDITAIKEQQRLLKDVYERERKIAETLQKSFLPAEPPLMDGYEIGHAYVPAQQGAQVGGDFYDLIEIGDGMLGLVMGDVSGKGVAAAVHTAMAKYMLRGFVHEDPQPGKVLKRLNDAITRYIRGGAFVTLFYGVLYTRENRLVYANAGHELPLFVRASDAACLQMESTGPAVGVIPQADYGQAEVQLSKGDAFVLYTDGVTEARRDNEFLGTQGLESVISGMGIASADEMADHILASVQDYTSNKLLDDLALVVVRSKPDAGGQ